MAIRVRIHKLGYSVWMFVCLICVHVRECGAAEGCDKLTGPSGSRVCITSDVYNGSQWATCVTNVYIKLQSGGRLHCTDPFASFCFYQCMIEHHGVEFGNVTADCACQQNITDVSTVPPPPSPLPTWCLSPPGTDCSWYDQCLQMKFGCDDTIISYVIYYARRFCTVHVESRSLLSNIGKQWFGNVSRCFQASFVPILRPHVNKTTTCFGIRNRAFEYYKDCYVMPYEAAPSICDLPTIDFWKIFWTIKASFVRASTPTLIDFLNTMMSCVNNTLPGPHDNIGVVKIIFPKINFDLGHTDNTTQYTAKDLLFGTISDILAVILGWQSQGVGWFVTSNNNTGVFEDQMSMILILADLYSLNVEYYHRRNVNLSAIVEQFLEAVRNGRLDVKVADWNKTLTIRHLCVCVDMNCENVSHNTTVLASGSRSAYQLHTSVLVQFVVLYILFMT